MAFNLITKIWQTGSLDWWGMIDGGDVYLGSREFPHSRVLVGCPRTDRRSTLRPRRAVCRLSADRDQALAGVMNLT